MRTARIIPFIFALLVLTGCATNFQPTPLPANHPASVEAPEAPRSKTKRLLANDELTRKTKAQLARQGVPDPDYPNGNMMMSPNESK
ncbi:MAG: hypothetical protein M3Y86_02785 [Verrucomicrobiota bacterium]|nr:hypothetical protein [Verrucomicrobiota bacterium]